MSTVEILGEHWALPDEALAVRWSRCLVESGDREPRDDGGQGSPYAWTSRATITSIKARAGELLMFHAAGLSDEDGAVAALIGPSGTGKSTASRLLCGDEFGYVTDETVAVDPDSGRVLPFAKPIAVIPENGGGKQELGPDELGLVRAGAQLQLQGLVLLERVPEMDAPEIEVLDLREGPLALAPHTSALAHLPSPVALLAETVDRCGGVHRVRYAEASTLVEAVRRALAAPPLGCSWMHHPSSDRPDPASTPAATDGAGELLVRAAYTDAIELAGDVQLMVGSRYLSLQGIGAVAWLLLDEPMKDEALVVAVIAAVGEHPDAEALVAAAVEELLKVGAVTRRGVP